VMRWFAKCFEPRPAITSSPSWPELLGGSSKSANGLRLSSSRFHSSSPRSLTWLARAARARTRFGKSDSQKAARLAPKRPCAARTPGFRGKRHM
jgi:hypothetical protein